MKYDPKVFEVETMEDAKRIIMTPMPGYRTEDRWQIETPYLVDLLIDKLQITEASVVLDYGCGIGRLAKPIIEQTNCNIIGVDASPSMRDLAQTYCSLETFFVCSPRHLAQMLAHGFQVRAAYCVYVLQHARKPQQDIHLLHRALRPQGKLLVVNSDSRWVPTVQGWQDDQVDVLELLRDRFEQWGHLSWPEQILPARPRLYRAKP